MRTCPLIRALRFERLGELHDSRWVVLSTRTAVFFFGRAWLMTDEAAYYVPLGKEFASHGSVNHQKGEYGRSVIHTPRQPPCPAMAAAC